MVERTFISLPSQLQLIERLQHLIYLSSSLIFVSGETGSGKSTLTENLSNSLNAELQQIYISLSNVPSADKLRQQIVGQLYDKPLFNSEDNLLDTILRLQASESKESNKLLIIDGADNLPDGFIIELCELFSGEDFVRDSTLNILLLADEKTNQQHLDYIEDNLISRMQAALNHVEFKLPPLSPEESLLLLQHNFKQASYKPEVQHQEALTNQLKECAGNPKKITQLAHDLSQGSVIPPRKYWLKTALPAILLMLVLVGIVSALGTYLYPKFITEKKVSPKPAPEVVKEKTQKEARLEHLLIQEKKMQEMLAGEWDSASAEVEENQQEVGLAEQKGQRVVVSDEELVKLVSAVEENTKRLLEEKGKQPTTSLSLSQTEDRPLQSGTQSEQYLPIDSQQNEDSQTLLSSLKRQAGLDIKDEAPVETVAVVIEPAVPSVVAPVVDSVAITNEVKEDVQQIEVENDLLLTEETLSPNETLTESASPELALQTNDEPELTESNVVAEQSQTDLTPTAILFNKSPEHYTLQLSGMATKRYVELFKEQSKFPQENLFLYETVYQNKPWFVVLYGDYDSVRSAQLAAGNLPDAFKGMSSWVKQWQLVHNELRLNDE